MSDEINQAFAEAETSIAEAGNGDDWKEEARQALIDCLEIIKELAKRKGIEL